ncbi:UDP-N-acetylglucosamine 2-epimerase [Nitrosotalea devaniterrae]|uniref:UDP-N-acetylglucosamine 2-epimerase n=1 Tax=Nitrosotalea devaniterrae TaxID=1078905 RepID=A0A128A0P3_9ARCH|nr:UDP-N-acetylglucosamine 2-epimerase [Candidatus Nitrosotalea devanaterra]
MTKKYSTRKIALVTGTRAEYGILKPLLHEIKQSKKLELCLIVAGTHLEKRFGHSIKEIIKDGFKVSYTVKMTPSGNTGHDMSVATSKGIAQFSEIYKKTKPDFNVILGDRDEAFAASIAAMHMNIINVHIHGGESSKGGIDEYMRHAITKISNLHFAATKQSAQRIIKMGENKKHVFVTGSPAVDGIITTKYLTKNQVLEKFKLKDNYVLVVQHPITTQTKDAKNQMKKTLDALVQWGKDAVIIGPNSDAGHREIFQIIKQYTKTCNFFKFYTNLARPDYLSLLKHCDFIIGNSSSGIIDAPSFKKPAINIGIRQLGRESANNVINTQHDTDSIIKSMKYAHSSQFQKILQKCTNPYGDGNASKRIIKILETIKITDDMIQKKISY